MLYTSVLAVARARMIYLSVSVFFSNCRPVCVARLHSRVSSGRDVSDSCRAYVCTVCGVPPERPLSARLVPHVPCAACVPSTVCGVCLFAPS